MNNKLLEKKIESFLKINANGYGRGYGSGYGNSCGEDFGFGSGTGHGFGSGYVGGYGSGNNCGSGSGGGKGYGRPYRYTYGNGNGRGKGYGKSSGRGGIASINGRKVYIIDKLPTIIYSIKNNIAKGAIINDYLTIVPCYIAKIESCLAHGETVKEAVHYAQRKVEEMPMKEDIKSFIGGFFAIDI